MGFSGKHFPCFVGHPCGSQHLPFTLRSSSHSPYCFSVVSRQLRNLHSDLPVVGPSGPDEAVETLPEIALEKSPVGTSEDDSLLDLSRQELHLDPTLQGAQNDTPKVQDVGTAESKPSINSNSSSDLPKQTQPAEGQPEPRPGGELSGPPELLHVTPDKSNWLDKTRSVILTPHHSDEM